MIFCAYHKCAYVAIGTDSTFQEWVSSGEFLTCECLYHSWDCEHGSGGYESGLRKKALECCDNDTGCDCLGELNCYEGNLTSCGVVADYCCGDEDGGCRCDYAKTACDGSLQYLTEEIVSKWEYSSECTIADDVCLAGHPLFDKKLDNICPEIKQQCGRGDGENCLGFANNCCSWNDVTKVLDLPTQDCKCEYMKKSCTTSLRVF